MIVRAFVVFDTLVVGLWLCDVLDDGRHFLDKLIDRLIFWDEYCELIGIALIHVVVAWLDVAVFLYFLLGLSFLGLYHLGLGLLGVCLLGVCHLGLGLVGLYHLGLGLLGLCLVGLFLLGLFLVGLCLLDLFLVGLCLLSLNWLMLPSLHRLLERSYILNSCVKLSARLCDLLHYLVPFSDRRRWFLFDNSIFLNLSFLGLHSLFRGGHLDVLLLLVDGLYRLRIVLRACLKIISLRDDYIRLRVLPKRVFTREPAIDSDLLGDRLHHVDIFQGARH